LIYGENSQLTAITSSTTALSVCVNRNMNGLLALVLVEYANGYKCKRVYINWFCCLNLLTWNYYFFGNM